MGGKVVIVPVGEVAGRVAERLALDGAAVVFVAAEEDAARAGREAAGVEASGAGRAAVYVVGADDLDGLAEFVAELFG